MTCPEGQGHLLEPQPAPGSVTGGFILPGVAWDKHRYSRTSAGLFRVQLLPEATGTAGVTLPPRQACCDSPLQARSRGCIPWSSLTLALLEHPPGIQNTVLHPNGNLGPVQALFSSCSRRWTKEPVAAPLRLRAALGVSGEPTHGAGLPHERASPSQCGTELWARREGATLGPVLPVKPSSAPKPRRVKTSESRPGLPGHFEPVFVQVAGQDMFCVANGQLDLTSHVLGPHVNEPPRPQPWTLPCFPPPTPLGPETCPHDAGQAPSGPCGSKVAPGSGSGPDSDSRPQGPGGLGSLSPQSPAAHRSRAGSMCQTLGAQLWARRVGALHPGGWPSGRERQTLDK